MQYRCPLPLCGMTTSTARELAFHMVCTTHLSEKHAEWIKAQGIDYRIVIAMRGKYYGTLVSAVESKCRTEAI
ncbi:MAG: hypothetical protein HY670_02895 [Chloroflexi bacterium]|nr:hypothetical protein [Chloroflexota bacterium]